LPGYADCDGIASNGCEVDTRASITDCGACNNVCTVTNGSPACSGGACVVGTCDANFGDCDGDYATGCEQRLDTLANCGVCGQVCDAPNASETCTGGVCRVGTCDPAWGDCDSNVLNGCETRIDTPLNCGSCGAACVANELCCGTSCRIASASDCGSCGATCDPGMLVVSEVMIDPVAVPDNQGEWIEVYNTTTSTIDLRGFTLRDDGADVHIITDFTPVVVPAGGYVTLGRNANLASNGGVVVDYQYASFVLGNAGDEVVLDAFGTVIDRVAYGTSFDIPAAATQLSQGTLTSTANDDPLNWCAATATLTGGDRGTPGADNRTCP